MSINNLALLGAQAPAWLAGSGLALDEAGFVAINAFQQSTSNPAVFSVGGAASRIDAPHARSGVYAVRAGSPLLGNLPQSCRAGRSNLTCRKSARSTRCRAAAAMRLPCGAGSASKAPRSGAGKTASTASSWRPMLRANEKEPASSRKCVRPLAPARKDVLQARMHVSILVMTKKRVTLPTGQLTRILTRPCYCGPDFFTVWRREIHKALLLAAGSWFGLRKSCNTHHSLSPDELISLQI